MSEPIFYYYLHYRRITLKLGHFLMTMWLLGILAGVLRGENIPPQRFASLAAPPNKRAKQSASPNSWYHFLLLCSSASRGEGQAHLLAKKRVSRKNTQEPCREIPAEKLSQCQDRLLDRYIL